MAEVGLGASQEQTAKDERACWYMVHVLLLHLDLAAMSEENLGCGIIAADVLICLLACALVVVDVL